MVSLSSSDMANTCRILAIYTCHKTGCVIKKINKRMRMCMLIDVYLHEIVTRNCTDLHIGYYTVRFWVTDGRTYVQGHDHVTA